MKNALAYYAGLIFAGKARSLPFRLKSCIGLARVGYSFAYNY
jgi:hypothetical protein